MAPEQSDLPEGLRSTRARERASAVEQIDDLTPARRRSLEAIRASEPDVWTRRAIDRKLAGPLGEVVPDESDEEVVVNAATVAEIYALARADAADLMAHEVRHAVLHVEMAAEREIEDYRDSDTIRAVDGLRSVARSLSQLADAEQGCSPVEVSLNDLVAEATVDLRQSLWPPELDGPVIVVRVDPDLLRLALSNCVRNAIDASEAAVHNSAPVLVTWGRTDRDAWVAVHDDGTGLPPDVGELFEPHHTTRGGSGHAGLGLTIASRAMGSMGGEVLLESRRPRGAVCELRWPLGQQ